MKATGLKSHYQLVLAITLFLFRCTDKPKDLQWDKVRIDSTISRNAVFQQLDQQQEITSFPEIPDSLLRRTSDVAYYTSQQMDSLNNPYAKFNNCRAYLSKPDNLIINIGSSDGFTGHGFIIKCKDGRFHTEAYLFSDNITENEREPIHTILYQKLTLNKMTYVIGDSLYGYIKFKSLEVNSVEDTVVHTGKGHFRAVVKADFRKD
ncbi:hypothetical protein LX87_05027 [Larkinella arboricola]|uniref:Uncharacterized protein n=1 Tax=Larkinella arboricola TaxID=643671 RepID=A0A327WUU9_LARAB|nr:hypothetical protein [Larkinella arboricola]RAJ92696.1 hypothetical protein LX87_05027 [Larkinella arboricola]